MLLAALPAKATLKMPTYSGFTNTILLLSAL